MSKRTTGKPDEVEQALRRGRGYEQAEDLDADAARHGGAGRDDGNGRRALRSDAAAAAAARVTGRIVAQGLADVSYATADSPFGPLLVAATKRGLVRVAFAEEDADATLERLAMRISPRIVEAREPLDAIRRELDEYFDGRRRHFALALDWTLVGPFGRRVLRVTSQIPYGGVLSYAEVAAEAGSPRGSRAAGNALGANPIPIVVPCHRVLRSGGALGGYGGGLERKRFLLELEGAR
ncbi:MAG TPA: methylated-DNA--[protein]-cysteine S-methyltransferase [Solirubrobacteraceae bacterium]|jgi:methylated-DNA-[protein]-cysteine S-methyltransferase